MKVLHVFTLATTAESFFDGQFGYLVENGCDITVIANSSLDGEFCNRNKVKSTIAPITREINPLTDLKAISSLIKEIIQNKYDVVVGHTPKGAMVAMIASLLAGTKKRVYFRHGLIYTTSIGIRRLLLKTIERITAFCSSNIINVSPSLCELAVKDRLNSSQKQTLIGLGTCGGIDTQKIFNPELICDDDKKQLRAVLGISASDFVIGFCGRICKEKGIRELIDGFNLFRRQNPTAKLLLVGAFDTRDILPDEYKNEIQNNPDIILTGRIEKNKLPLYYSVMNVFVFPSYREGFGMCVIEASAMKCPILVSRSHGCIDSIRENVTGEYIDISSIGIIHGLESMLDKDKRDDYGSNGRKWVVETFDYEVVWPMIKEFYSTLI